jgi:hypothetical protein
MPEGVSEQLREKLCLVYVDQNNYTYAGGEYSNGYVSGSVRRLGSYSVGIDTLPPVIRPLNFIPGSDISGKSEVIMTIGDDFSGLSDYEVTIDDKWALFEWDPKRGRLTHKLDDTRTARNSLHTIKSVATDSRGNTNIYTTQFYW